MALCYGDRVHFMVAGDLGSQGFISSDGLMTTDLVVMAGTAADPPLAFKEVRAAVGGAPFSQPSFAYAVESSPLPRTTSEGERQPHRADASSSL